MVCLLSLLDEDKRGFASCMRDEGRWFASHTCSTSCRGGSPRLSRGGVPAIAGGVVWFKDQLAREEPPRPRHCRVPRVLDEAGSCSRRLTRGGVR